jgi:hypothetical protein
LKVKQKVSGGFRGLEGAIDVAVIRSFISTAKKLGWNIIQPFTQGAKIQIAGTPNLLTGKTQPGQLPINKDREEIYDEDEDFRRSTGWFFPDVYRARPSVRRRRDQ